MGYRSDVCIKCEEKAYRMFEQAWKEFTPDEIKKDIENYYYINWNYVKWYEYYTDVSAIINVMSELNKFEDESDEIEGYRYKMIRFGEDDADVEVKENSYDIEFYYVRYFDIPNNCELIKQ